MLIRRRFVYELTPITLLKEQGLGNWGFGATIDGEFADKVRRVEIPNKSIETLQKMGREIIRQYFSKEFGSIENPYQFVEKSWLLRGVTVPGSAPDLSLDEEAMHLFLPPNWDPNEKELPPWVDYSPHNVDSKDQAYCLQALWLEWANTANMIINTDT